jgi:hypothetical protein
MSATTGDPRPWHCRACGALLGVEHRGELHIKYKEAQYFVRGHCRHDCRRCGATNAVLTRASPAAPAPPPPQGDRP